MIKLLDKVRHIEQLYLRGEFSYFNLDNLVNLKVLSLYGSINESFNFDLFKNLCNRLEDLNIILNNFDEKIFSKLFDGNKFSKLKSFSIRNYNMKRLKKEFINRFPNIYQLFISDCNLEEIEADAFSNFRHLCCLDLSQNQLKFIEKDTFSNLKNLQKLDLSENKLTNLSKELIAITIPMTHIVMENTNFKTFSSYWVRC